MKNEQKNKEKATRRFCEKVDGQIIHELYSRMKTAELARLRGLTETQVVNYVQRRKVKELTKDENKKTWASKDAAHLSKVNRENGKKGGRPKKNS